MKKKILFIAQIIMMLHTAEMVAQEVWTLDRCMNYAVDQSPRVRHQEVQGRIYEEYYKESVAGLFPSVSAATGLSMSFGRSINPATNTYENVSNLNNAYQLTASLPLFDGLSSWYLIRYREAGKLRGLKEVEQVKAELALDVMQAYYDALYYERLVLLAELQLKQTQQELRLMSKREELGLSAGNDRLQIESKVAADSLNLVRQQNYQHLSLIRLKELMNYPMETELRIETVLAECNPQMVMAEVAAIKTNALTTLPEVAQSELAIKEADLQYKMAKSSLYPYLSLSGGIGTNYFENLNSGATKQSFASQFRNNRGEYIALNMSFPIFNRLSNVSRIKRSRYQYEQTKCAHEVTLNRLEREVEQAAADLVGAGREWSQAQKQLEAMQVAHQVNRKRYEKGVISVLDLFTSDNQLLQAEVDVLSSHIRYLLKEKLVGYYCGVPLNGISE